MIRGIEKIQKEKVKVMSEISKMKESLEKAKASSVRCQANNEKLQDRILKKKALNETEKAKMDSASEFWSWMGLKILPLDGASKVTSNNDLNGNEAGDQLDNRNPSFLEGNFSFEFSRLNPQDPSTKHVVKVSFENNSCKITETDPHDLLSLSDLDEIESKAVGVGGGKEGEINGNFLNGNDKTHVDARLLAVLLRHRIQANMRMK